jgi:hypothetical protein
MKAAREEWTSWAPMAGTFPWSTGGSVVAVVAAPVVVVSVDVPELVFLDPEEEESRWLTRVPPSPRVSTAATAQ